MASVVSQTAVLSSSRAAVSLGVDLGEAPYLPASLALELSDPSVADVTPAVVTWRPGETGTKQFLVQLNRLLPSKGLQATLVPINNVLASAARGSVAVQAPHPRFAFTPNQVCCCCCAHSA